eukprot:7071221-Alexandrium_andersonii.AAC.1
MKLGGVPEDSKRQRDHPLGPGEFGGPRSPGAPKSPVPEEAVEGDVPHRVCLFFSQHMPQIPQLETFNRLLNAWLLGLFEHLCIGGGINTQQIRC